MRYLYSGRSRVRSETLKFVFLVHPEALPPPTPLGFIRRFLFRRTNPNQLELLSLFPSHARTARMVPGISGVPEELRNLGVGPLLYSVLLRSPGLSDALLEMAAKLGLSSFSGK